MRASFSPLQIVLSLLLYGPSYGKEGQGEHDLSHHRRHSHGQFPRNFHSSDLRGGASYSGRKSSFDTYFDQQESSQNITLLIGEMALLHCTVRNIGNKSVSWLRHRTHIPDLLALNNLTNSLDTRITAIHSHGSEEYVLRIKNVEIRDSGKYECQVGGSSPSDTIYKFIFLEVLEPVTRIIGGDDIYVDRGSTLNVTCVVSAGSRSPKYIFWSHNAKILLFDGSETSKIPYLPRDSKGRFYSRLIIRKIEHSHAGTYKFLAVANGEGNQSSSRSPPGELSNEPSNKIAAPVQQQKPDGGGTSGSFPHQPRYPLLILIIMVSLILQMES
ncbi:unnamed protein product [Lepeophtheirus salmonis]|uniref:(salmon louse) hypothetical protein n=1 Tax=Lepeophtheirus salmonis TaxID=72036 RepID=A0A7R8H1D2_LEPSM|nr:unnamed protein product [Lepeophtheirus salmonis]CAF2805209.1 unnamed protein product [Lepeophtheirus salmonis]